MCFIVGGGVDTDAGGGYGSFEFGDFIFVRVEDVSCTLVFGGV